MKNITLILLMASLCTGCSIVACDRVFPHFTWYWSAEAKRCRADHEMEKKADEQWKDSQSNTNK